MYALALIGGVILLIGAFLPYTSRPDLFPDMDRPGSPGGVAAIAAGLAAIAISWNALHWHHPHVLVFLAIPAGFTALQFFLSRNLMARTARQMGERILPGPGMLLSLLGAGLTGYVGYHIAHAR